MKGMVCSYHFIPHPLSLIPALTPSRSGYCPYDCNSWSMVWTSETKSEVSLL